MDLYDIGLKDIIITAAVNNMKDKVTTYLCDEVSKLPKHEKFDLVVANPPHCIWDITDNMSANNPRILHFYES
jgi:tRNA1(Val) A37 N6-methylase TrmN6